MRGRALVVADETLLRSASADPSSASGSTAPASLRGEPDLAADWFVAYGTKLPPAAQADAMAEWMFTLRRPAHSPVGDPRAAVTAAPAAVTARRATTAPAPVAAPQGAHYRALRAAAQASPSLELRDGGATE